MTVTALALIPETTIEKRPTDLITEWHEHLNLIVRAGDMSGDTAAAYKRGVKKFQDWFSENPHIQAMSQNAVLDWKGYLKDSGKAPASVNVWLAGVRAFCAWACSLGYIPSDPTLGVKSATRRGSNKTHKREALTDEEIIRLLNLNMRKRDRAIIWLLAYTATRGVELYRANIEDLQTKGGELCLYVQGKGKQDKDEYVVIASAEARAAVYDYLAERGTATGPLFATEYEYKGEPRRLARNMYRQIIKPLFVKAGIVSDRKTVHSLRHTALTNALKNGASIQEVQATARHANIATTMIYAHNINRLKDAAEKRINYNAKSNAGATV